MQYTFTKYKSNLTRDSYALKLYAKNISIGREAYRILGNPIRVDVYYDVQNKAIKLEPNESGRKITVRREYIQLSISLSRILPIGKYENKDGVFVYTGTEEEKGSTNE